MHSHDLRRAICHACYFGNAERRRVRRQDGVRSADLVEKSEDFDLRFHLLRYGFDDQVCLASSLVDGTGVFKALNRSFRVARRKLSQFHGFFEVGADLCIGAPQGVWKDVFQNCAVTTHRRGLRDATSHDARADYGNCVHLGHYLPPCSSEANTDAMLGSDLWMYSASLCRSSDVMAGM